MMGLTTVQRQAATKTNTTRYKRADKAGKGLILDELCATTGCHRNHARKALTQALTPRLVRHRAPRVPIYGPEVTAALAFCRACRVGIRAADHTASGLASTVMMGTAFRLGSGRLTNPGRV